MLKNFVPLYPISVPTPFDVGPVNMYLITEPEPVLVDTGPGLADSLEVLKKLLGERGVPLERLRKIVLTHAHQDHCGMAAPLAELSGAPIYASPLEGEALRKDSRLGAFYLRMMEEAGLSPEMVARQREHIQAVRAIGGPVDDFRPIEELGALRCGPSTFRVVPTPGHTPGSISLWDSEGRILIAGDTVIKKITPNPFLAPQEGAANGRFRALQNYLETLGRIRALQPALRKECTDLDIPGSRWGLFSMQDDHGCLRHFHNHLGSIWIAASRWSMSEYRQLWLRGRNNCSIWSEHQRRDG